MITVEWSVYMQAALNHVTNHTCTLQSSADAGLQEPGPKKPRTAAEIASSSADMMTSKDYYFDSYSHFGKEHCVSTLV